MRTTYSPARFIIFRSRKFLVIIQFISSIYICTILKNHHRDLLIEDRSQQVLLENLVDYCKTGQGEWDTEDRTHNSPFLLTGGIQVNEVGADS